MTVSKEVDDNRQEDSVNLDRKSKVPRSVREELAIASGKVKNHQEDPKDKSGTTTKKKPLSVKMMMNMMMMKSNRERSTLSNSQHLSDTQSRDNLQTNTSSLILFSEKSNSNGIFVRSINKNKDQIISTESDSQKGSANLPSHQFTKSNSQSINTDVKNKCLHSMQSFNTHILTKKYRKSDRAEISPVTFVEKAVTSKDLDSAKCQQFN